MHMETLERWIALYGSDTAHWPEDILAQYHNLLTQDASLSAALADAQAFDALLLSSHQPQARADFAHRITEDAFTHVQAARMGPLTRLHHVLEAFFADLQLPQPAFTIPALLLLGMLGGFTTANSAPQSGVDVSPSTRTFTYFDSREVL